MQRQLLLLSMAMAILFAACGDSSADPIFDTAAESTTTAAPSTTTPGSTTTTPASTTSMAATTTSSTTTSSTTTTAPPPPIVFSPAGLGIAAFGDAPPDVIAAFEARLGAPSLDSGWIPGGGGPYGVCPGTEYRRVEFLSGDLALQFTDAGYFAPEGVRQFYAYAWDGGTPGPTPGPPVSVDAGTTVQQILAMHPDAEIIPDDVFFGPVFRVQPGGWAQLWGRLTGTTGTDTVINLIGGVGCGE